jgi:hypothetical protein
VRRYICRIASETSPGTAEVRFSAVACDHVAIIPGRRRKDTASACSSTYICLVGLHQTASFSSARQCAQFPMKRQTSRPLVHKLFDWIPGMERSKSAVTRDSFTPNNIIIHRYANERILIQTLMQLGIKKTEIKMKVCLICRITDNSAKEANARSFRGPKSTVTNSCYLRCSRR